MRAFGREVASKTLVNVLTVVALGLLTAVWGAVWLAGPRLAEYYGISRREAAAWAIVGTLLIAIIVLASCVAALRKRKAGTFTLVPHSGTKPCVTLTHRGEQTTYWIDGKIIVLVDSTENPAPAPFQCELHVGDEKGASSAALNDGQWANVILGSIEKLYGDDDYGLMDRFPIGDTLVIRRGKMGVHVRVPDAGAILELAIRTVPPAGKRTNSVRFYKVSRDSPTTVAVKEEQV